ncbi:MAG: SIMPL domain-containing protein [Pseudomonadota bacterium]
MKSIHMKVLALSVVLFFAGCRAGGPTGDIERGVLDTQTIMVVGMATAAVDADQARVHLELTSEEADLVEATKSLGAGIQEISRKAKKIGLSEDQIESAGIRILPSQRQPNRNTTDAIYICQAQVFLTFTDIAMVQPFLIDVLPTQNVNAFDVQYINTQEVALRSKTRDAAILDAKKKAEATVAVLGASLGRAMFIKGMSDNPMESSEAASGGGGNMGRSPQMSGNDPLNAGLLGEKPGIEGMQQLPASGVAVSAGTSLPSIALPGEFRAAPWKISVTEVLSVSYEVIK